MIPGGDSGGVSTMDEIPEGRAPDALKQADVLVPAVTQANDPPAPTTPKAAPANTGSPSLPEPTTASSSGGSAAEILKLDPLDPGTKQSGDPSQSSPVQNGASAAASDPQPTDSSSPALDSSDDSAAKSDPNSANSDKSKDPSQNDSDQKEAPAPAPESQKSDQNFQPTVPQAPTTINLGGAAPSTQGVGALINGALGGGSVPASAPSPSFTPHPIVALGQTLSITDPSAVEISGSTLSVGGPAHTSDGKYYSLASSGNLIAGTLAPSPEPSPPPVLSVAGSTYTPNSASEFVVMGQTLTPGGQIMVASTPISLHPSADVAIIGGSTQVLTTASSTPNPAVLKFASSTYTANAASQFFVVGQTLTPGGQILVSSTPISLLPSADIAVVAGSSQVLTPPASSPNPATMTFAGSTYTANTASQFIVAGQTLRPGGQITVSSTTLSLAPSANIAVIGTSTQFLATASAILTAEAPVMTWDGSTYTADAASDFVIASKTLTPGGIITVLGTPIRLAPGAGDVVIGSSTLTLSSAVITPADVLTVGGQTITANPTGFAVAGATVLPGGKGVTVAGTPVSLASGGTLVVGNSTTVLPTEGPSAGAAVFEGGQGKLGALGTGWLFVSTLGFWMGIRLFASVW